MKYTGWYQNGFSGLGLAVPGSLAVPIAVVRRAVAAAVRRGVSLARLGLGVPVEGNADLGASNQC
jgi:hypothetical protein